MLRKIVSLQVMSKDEYVGKKCSSQEVSKIISRLKIKISSLKLKDITSNIKIQDHKHAKGTAKEFPRIQGSKIQDVTRSEAIKVNELIEHVNQKTYAYADVHAKNQDLLITIYELKAKLVEQAKNVNTKFEKSATLEKLVCVTPLNKNKDLKATIVSKVEIKTDKSKPVTSRSTSKNEQSQKKNANVIARGMYRITKAETKTLVDKTNKFSCNSIGVASSSSVSISESKDTRVLLNTKSKPKTVNAVHDGLNFVCVSCGKDFFMISHDKCAARYALSLNSRVKRAFFTSPVAVKSSQIGATHVVVKSRFSVATPPKATTRVSSALPLTPESRQSQSLSTYMKNKIKTSRKWQKWFEHQSSFNWSPKSSNAKTSPHVSKSNTSHRTNSKTPVIQIVLWIVDSGCSKHMNGNLKLLRNFIEKFMGTVRFGNDKFAAITGYGDYFEGNLTICHVYYVEGLRHNLFSIGQFCDGDLEAQVLKIQSDNGTKLKNAILKSSYEKLGILHHTSIAQMPQQNGVVERRNRTLVEAARTMLIFSKLPEFLWAEAISTACFNQNRSLVHPRYNKMPYELIKGRKPNVQYFHVFGSLCYPTTDRDDLGKIKPKADIGIFVGYFELSSGFHIYNRRTRKVIETIHVKFDELTIMASECNNSGPSVNCLNFQDSSKEMNDIPSQQDLDNLFGPLYKEYYVPRAPKVSNNSAANTLDTEDTPSSSSIIVEDSDAPQIVTSSEEPIA
ncbi:retrovirus-related pol polyprotein from transposon TNT 1-94 [Tanacetum coccineum]